MINKLRFRLKKNGEPKHDCYCRHPELIENYAEAIADETQTWEVHHRLESCFTQDFLKKMGLYYDVEPEVLIFLTRADHNALHNKSKRRREKWSICRKGRKLPLLSEERKAKISAAHKGMHWHLVNGKREWY